MPHTPYEFDVAIVGAGPAGLSAARTLGRACRRVVVFDHGKPRNFAAQAIHCYLRNEGISPGALREQGRKEASAYRADFVDAEVVGGRCLTRPRSNLTAFSLETVGHTVRVRAILLATGMTDCLPEIPGLRDFYGASVHHCPYCDGWEHRDQSLVALGTATGAVKLAATLRGWSDRLTACTNGESISEVDRTFLKQLEIECQEERISELRGQNGALQSVAFNSELSIPCDAVFFSSGQGQRSHLPELLDCDCDDEGTNLKAESTRHEREGRVHRR
jgi:thioredoxin reductase